MSEKKEIGDDVPKKVQWEGSDEQGRARRHRPMASEEDENQDDKDLLVKKHAFPTGERTQRGRGMHEDDDDSEIASLQPPPIRPPPATTAQAKLKSDTARSHSGGQDNGLSPLSPPAVRGHGTNNQGNMTANHAKVGAFAVEGIDAQSDDNGSDDLEMGRESPSVETQPDTVVAQAITVDELAHEFRDQLRSELRDELHEEMRGQVVHAEAVVGDGTSDSENPVDDKENLPSFTGRRMIIILAAILLIIVGGVVGAVVPTSLGGGDASSNPDPTAAPGPTQAPTQDLPVDVPIIARGADLTSQDVDDRFGKSVYFSDDGETLAISAITGKGGGYVEVYRWDGTKYTQIGQTVLATADFDEFGRSIALSGDGITLAVGAWKNDDNGDLSGNTRIFRFNGTSWNQLGQTLVGDAAEDHFGWWVSLSGNGDTLASTARLGDPSESLIDAGYVRVYRWSGDMWNQLGSDLIGEIAEAQFGRSTSLSSSGTRIAVGAIFGGDRKGRIRIFEYNGNDWVQLGQNLDGEQVDDFQGTSVKLSGNGAVVAIGADGNDRNGSKAGLVRVYGLEGGTWTQLGQNLLGEFPGDQFGASIITISSDGTVLGVPSPRYDSRRGKVYLYIYYESQWLKVLEIEGKRTADQFGAGIAVSADGTAFAAGAEQGSYVKSYSILQ